MGKAILESHGNLKRAEYLLQELASKINEVSYQDKQKILKVSKYVTEHKSITPKQFRALTHYSKVYGVKVLQSLDFLLD